MPEPAAPFPRYFHRRQKPSTLKHHGNNTFFLLGRARAIPGPLQSLPVDKQISQQSHMQSQRPHAENPFANLRRAQPGLPHPVLPFTYSPENLLTKAQQLTTHLALCPKPTPLKKKQLVASICPLIKTTGFFLGTHWPGVMRSA